MRRNTWTLVFIVIGLLVLAGIVAYGRAYLTQTGLAVPPKWVAGDEWTWHNSDGRDVSFRVTGVRPDWYDVQVRSGSTTTTTRVLLDLSLQNADWFRFQWPITPGHAWTYEVVGIVNGRNTTWEGTARAVRMETVTVPAGTFDAVRIDGRHCNLSAGQCGAFTLWFAPKAKYVVKLAVGNSPYWVSAVRGFQQELVSYQVH